MSENQTTKIRLTPAQWQTLREAARSDTGIGAPDQYKPTQKLLALGLVTQHERRTSYPRFVVTDAGRAVLQEQP